METQSINGYPVRDGNYPFWRFWYKQLILRKDGKPYMFRNTILGIGKLFTIKYHKVVESDDDCLHDHPWSFLSIILKGGYWEYTYETDSHTINALNNLRAERVGSYSKAPDGRWIKKTFYKPGTILWRPAPWPHRLELDQANGKSTPCHSLVFTGRVFRKWGFFTKVGWKYWRDYDKAKHC